MLIDGLYNFRDTGGLPIAGGGVTQPGVLYRSASLAEVTPRGLDAFASTKVGVVVDYRTTVERDAAPDRLPTSRPIQLVNLSLLQGAMSQMTENLVPPGGSPDPDQIARALESLPTLGELYTGMLQSGVAQFVKTARLIAAETPGAPAGVLVHCTAGKDRTGVATALMLEAAGVVREAVVADYASSQQHLAGEWADGMLQRVQTMGVPLTPRLKTLITGTPPEAIEEALSWVENEHGGAAGYLRAGGLTTTELHLLQTRFTG